jgi:inorganic triphosphatase YgiF
VKFPAPDDRAGGVMVRSEIDVDGPPDCPPEAVRRGVSALARGAALEPVARLVTTRQHVGLRTDGTDAAELDDDEVQVSETGDEPTSFREIEVELAPDGGPAVLDWIVEALRAAGAGPADPTPKLVRALGPRATAPPDLVAPGPVAVDARLADALRAPLVAAVLGLQEAHPAVCFDGGPAAVRALRRQVRHVRTLLWLASDVAEGEVFAQLRADLRWLGALLRAVGEVDAQRLRIQRASRRLADAVDVAEAGQLARLLEPERRGRVDLVLDELGSPRYGDLVDALVVAAGAPPWSPRGEEPAATALPRLVRPAWRRLRKAVVAVDTADDQAGLHEVRRLAGRVRIGTQAAEPVAGSGAPRLAAALGDVRRALGDVEETAASVTWLRETASQATRRQAFVAGLLLAAEHDAHRQALGRWRDAWDRADRHKATRWLS